MLLRALVCPTPGHIVLAPVVFDFLVEILKFLYEKNWTRKKIGWLVSWMLNFLIWNWIQHKIFRHVKTVEGSILLFFSSSEDDKKGSKLSWKFCDISSKMICTNSFMICRFSFIYTCFHRRAEFNLFIFFRQKERRVLQSRAIACKCKGGW